MKTREITVRGPFSGKAYTASAVQQDLAFQGWVEREIEAVLMIQEEISGDVIGRIQGEAIMCESRGGRPFVIENMRIKLPKTTSLRLRTVSGEVKVEAFEGASTLEIQTISGDVSVSGCLKIGEFKGHSVSGDITLGACQVDHVFIKTVSGDAALQKSRVTRLQFDSVSGDVTKRDSLVEAEEVDQIKGIGSRIAQMVTRQVEGRATRT